jgi:hypothetical protein
MPRPTAVFAMPKAGKTLNLGALLPALTIEHLVFSMLVCDVLWGKVGYKVYRNIW